MWTYNAAFKQFVFESPAARIAARMMRANKVNIFYDQLLIREPGTVKRTPWHHDMPYWPLVGWQVCTIWLALDRVTKDSGAVEYVRGSHKWGIRAPEPRQGLEVEADAETFAPGTLVVAAGAWSGQLGRLLGVELPVRPVKREVFVSEALPDHPAGTPMVIEPDRAWYCRREGPGVLMAGGLGPGTSFDTQRVVNIMPCSRPRGGRRAPA